MKRMKNMQLKVKKLTPTAKLPNYAHATDSGMDLYADESVVIQPGHHELVQTGIAIALPPNTEAQVRPKSGIALKTAVTVLNTPGTVDEGFRGEIGVILINLGDESYHVEKGKKIAQMVIVPVLRPEIVVVDDLDDSDRGVGGFGSTGL